MHLKSIELENFKSFGGKVTIPLMDGYMAVTGPNGSGKSNIGDAIMFVLGPRSPKAVRAARIPDLVFSNAGKGKADYMKATLVFENTDRILPWDSDEVRLTRYVKLKGENKDDYVSYFYINGQPSKLSEFEELLSKARISADGYNIVQQGDVTHIIQMGAMERRRILDGISGIASFDADLEKAAGERTEADERVFVEQRKRIARFERWVSEHSVGRVGVMRNDGGAAAEGQSAENEAAVIQQHTGQQGWDLLENGGRIANPSEHCDGLYGDHVTVKDVSHGDESEYEERAPQVGIDYGQRGIDDI